MKLRLIDPVFFSVRGDGTYMSSPRIKGRVKVHPLVVGILTSAPDGIDTEALTAESENVALAIAKLHGLGYLTSMDNAGDRELPAPWKEWGALAWQFHQSIRDAPFVRPESEGIAEYYESLNGRERPANSRRMEPDGEILLLPRVRARMPVSFQDVLEGRRTHRDFSGDPIPLDEFATLLQYSFGPLRFIDAGKMGVLELRANASGGSRHETEAYVVVLNVVGVDPGIYRYEGIRHGLVPVREAVPSETLEHLTFNQGFFEKAGFGVFTTAFSTRMSWKYPHPRAYKMLLHNVGHVAQVFSMTSVALGLGAAISGAFRDTEVEQLLGNDEPGEFATFVMVCGIPVQTGDGLPVRYRTPSAAFVP
ncbi:SagB/ThcOx family dehydrogenase [Streptomyces scopuliridis]|uniref:SagB/ThcOx family dehydrogenase n=1 Tax=Streptomyces scopuliridis TaxID=452529 RepID=A0ACD4ZW04_9ACTN|nr:SagB/ThcOx family dehydrogenase [Streptomyces scopuliridis]WSB37894.1 SagB/ThcOx family dehydrogenase [Streptomyces scopuliridis]WSC02346.1 SagB/ThcOx family dehydrogenase [Streptomyces scopuliridis]WSC04117.1 SagB/ThcOx family dehydrogenase [Streptomyces scopuliridis]